jgi:hypothetical protein
MAWKTAPCDRKITQHFAGLQQCYVKGLKVRKGWEIEEMGDENRDRLSPYLLNPLSLAFGFS